MLQINRNLNNTLESEQKNCVVEAAPAAINILPNKILLVEDCEAILSVFIKLLAIKYKNAIIETGNNGLTALNKLQSFMPDLIITDIMMPEMDGVDFIQAVRSNHSMDNIKIIVITAMSQNDDIFEVVKKLPIDGILSKPINKLDLYEIIDRIFKDQKTSDKCMTTNEINIEPQNLTGRDIIKKWISMTNDSELQNIVFDTIKELPERLRKIKTYIKDSNIDELKKETHTLKGTTGTLGMYEIYMISNEINNSVRNENRDFSRLNALASDMEEIVVKVCG